MANDLTRWSFNYTSDLIVKEISENEIEASHKKILNIIRNSGDDGMSTTQIAKVCQGMKARDRNEILQTLVESGDLLEEVIKGSIGRDRRVYRARVR
jgi:response regulator of citrate/malate metabolism